MTSLAWAVSFVLMLMIMGGTILGSVGMIERGQNKRSLEDEKTKRQGMENAWQLEHAKMAQLPAGTPPSTGIPAEVVFDLKDTYR
jgi:hypothetical protein